MARSSLAVSTTVACVPSDLKVGECIAMRGGHDRTTTYAGSPPLSSSCGPGRWGGCSLRAVRLPAPALRGPSGWFLTAWGCFAEIEDRPSEHINSSGAGVSSQPEPSSGVETFAFTFGCRAARHRLPTRRQLRANTVFEAEQRAEDAASVRNSCWMPRLRREPGSANYAEAFPASPRMLPQDRAASLE
jgi:hypothetical protein